MVTPTINKEAIRARVGERSFARGAEYFRTGAIFDARQQGATLKARCRGSQGGPYRVEAELDETGIGSADCSCPVGGGGSCKHVAALLLTWLERPEQFVEREALDSALDRRSKAELIALVKQMLRQEPDLEWLLEAPLPAAGKQGSPIDPQLYRRQAASLFQNAEYEWGVEGEIAEGLLALKEIGDGFAAQEDHAGAAAVYGAVLAAVLENSDTFPDEEGELGSVIGECVEGLGQCLKSGALGEETRAAVVAQLWEVYRFDVNQGGRGIGDEASELLLQQTTPEERRTIAGWVREAIPNPGQWSTNWRRETLGGFLLDLEADTLDDETFLQVCRETGRTDDLVDRLLTLGRIDEAIAAAEPASDYGLVGLADLFVTHGHASMAECLMRERSEKSEDARVLNWLKERYLARDDQAAALEMAERMFRRFPSLEGYQEVRGIARALGRWDTLRPDLMALAGAQKDEDLLIEIYLDEGEIDRALEAVNSRSMSWGYIDGMKLAVAEAAEATRPSAALELYQQQVERYIAARGRASYQGACELLPKIRALYERMGESGAWDAYITTLREQNRSLRALKEELAAAGL
jgi:uncharacterized Zn finger protein